MVIRLGNSIKDLMGVCKLSPTLVGDSRSFDIRACVVANLTPLEKEEMFNLFEINMKQQYLQNWGWNPLEKRNEMFHPMNRFLCVYESTEEMKGEGGEDGVVDKTIFELKQIPYSERKLVAYTMFRFDWDDEEEPEHPVLYCYELQVCSTFQGDRIGRILMEQLINISEKLKLWKVLLTCFVSNSGALKFYRSIGFDSDVNSPIAQGMTNCDYEILSNKPLLR